MNPDIREWSLIIAAGALLALCVAFGIGIWRRVVKAGEPVRVEVRNTSMGGVLGSYSASTGLVVFICYLLTLALFAGVAMQLKPGVKETEKKDPPAQQQPACGGASVVLGGTPGQTAPLAQQPQTPPPVAGGRK